MLYCMILVPGPKVVLTTPRGAVHMLYCMILVPGPKVVLTTPRGAVHMLYCMILVPGPKVVQILELQVGVVCSAVQAG